MSGTSKAQVSKLCKDIDERVSSFLERPLEGDWLYVWLDATYLRINRQHAPGFKLRLTPPTSWRTGWLALEATPDVCRALAPGASPYDL